MFATSRPSLYCLGLKQALFTYLERCRRNPALELLTFCYAPDRERVAALSNNTSVMVPEPYIDHEPERTGDFPRFSES